MSGKKSVGSLYINASKDAPSEVKSKMKQIIEYIRENGYISISLNPDTVGGLPKDNKGYLVLKGYKNKFNDDNFYVTHTSLSDKLSGGAPAKQASGSITLDL